MSQDKRGIDRESDLRVALETSMLAVCEQFFDKEWENSETQRASILQLKLLVGKLVAITTKKGGADVQEEILAKLELWNALLKKREGESRNVGRRVRTSRQQKVEVQDLGTDKIKVTTEDGVSRIFDADFPHYPEGK